MSRDLIDYQKNYLEQPYERFQVAFRKRKIKEILSNYNHNNLLEIGSGLESIFLDLNSFDKLTVVEPANLFYNKAIEDKILFPNKDIQVINKYLEDAVSDLENKNFNFILVSSLLHEISEKDSFLNCVFKIANNQSIIHINVPNANSFHRLLAVKMGLISNVFQPSKSNVQFQQATIFDIISLKKLCIDNGFKIVDEGAYSFKPFTHDQMEKMIQANLITKEMLNGFYAMESELPNLGSEIYVNITKE